LVEYQDYGIVVPKELGRGISAVMDSNESIIVFDSFAVHMNTLRLGTWAKIVFRRTEEKSK
jgi:hypothetical protein